MGFFLNGGAASSSSQQSSSSSGSSENSSKDPSYSYFHNSHHHQSQYQHGGDVVFVPGFRPPSSKGSDSTDTTHSIASWYSSITTLGEAGGPSQRHSNGSGNHSGNSNIVVVSQTRHETYQHTDDKLKWMAIALGQAIALLAGSVNAASFTMAQEYQLNTQFMQMLGTYALLTCQLHGQWRKATTTTTPATTTPQQPPPPRHTIPGTSIPLRIPWWVYAILCALFDVLPNALILLSYQYTSLTSITLLGSITVPATMLCSRFLLARSFARHHYAGVFLCLLGGSLMVWCDDTSNATSTTATATTTTTSDVAAAEIIRASAVSPQPVVAVVEHAVWGDVLVVTAAMLFGVGDTIAEYAIKHMDWHEYLGMIGLFGMLQSFVGVLIFELPDVWHLLHQPVAVQLQVAAVLIWYTISVYGYYRAETQFLSFADATLLNMSLQASNVYAVGFSIVAYHILPPMLFYGAALAVVVGVFVYEKLYCWNSGCCSSSSSSTTATRTRLTDTNRIAFVPIGDADENDNDDEHRGNENDNDVMVLISNHPVTYGTLSSSFIETEPSDIDEDEETLSLDEIPILLPTKRTAQLYFV